MSTIPAFTHAAPTPRSDGWSAERQDAFIEYLATGHTVVEAATRVGRTKQSA